MGEKVEMRLYTVSQLKDWLYHNAEVEGLTEVLIDKTRAHALVTNPYVRDDMSLVSALFVDGKVGAYTYAFPDLMEKPKDRLIYWNTTLYVNPKFEGRGYAYCVIAAICELYGEDYFDLDAAAASVENLKYCGLTVKYTPQYVLKQKAISSKDWRGRAAYAVEEMRQRRRSREKELLKEIKENGYRLQYVRWVDDETYDFIRAHAETNLFLRRQETFNWILQHPFMQEAPLGRRVRRRCRFSSARMEFGMYGIVVMKKDGELPDSFKTVGFVVLRATRDEWAVKYIYYDEASAKDVYLAVAEHLLTYRKSTFCTADKRLHDFVAGYRLYAHDTIYEKSFAYPAGFEYDEGQTIQAGEGDNVT